MKKSPSQDTQSKDPEPIDEDPESPRDLIPGNIPLGVAIALLLLPGILALLIARG